MSAGREQLWPTRKERRRGGQRDILTAALAEYTDENGISPDSDEYEDTRQLLIMLYERQGHRTVAALKAAFVAAIQRER